MNAVACIGTAIVLFPVVKRYGEAAALGFVAARILEAAVTFTTGVAALLSMVSLREESPGVTETEATALLTTGRALVAVHDWTFLLGPGIVPGFNALLLGYLMYRSALVPRFIPTIGLLGAPLILASGTATIFGLHDQVSATAGLAGLPIAALELSLGLWMTFKGFRIPADSQPSDVSPSP